MATIIVFMKTRRQQTFKCIVDHVKSDYVLHSRREIMSWIDDGRESLGTWQPPGPVGRCPAPARPRQLSAS